MFKRSKFRKREWKYFISNEGMSELPGAARPRPPARLTTGSWELMGPLCGSYKPLQGPRGPGAPSTSPTEGLVSIASHFRSPAKTFCDPVFWLPIPGWIPCSGGMAMRRSPDLEQRRHVFFGQVLIREWLEAAGDFIVCLWIQLDHFMEISWEAYLLHLVWCLQKGMLDTSNNR